MGGVAHGNAQKMEAKVERIERRRSPRRRRRKPRRRRRWIVTRSVKGGSRKRKRKKALFKGDDKPLTQKEKEREKREKAPKKDKDGLSVDEWNAVRQELGLKPLG